MLHPRYLPFTAEQLRACFAAVGGETADKAERRLDYYRRSIAANTELVDRIARGEAVDQLTVRAGRQMEKDERFWIAAALMALYHRGQHAERATRFGGLLTRARLSPPPGFSTWEAALSGHLSLFLEANLPSPRSYQVWLREHLAQRVPVPHLQEQAERATRLEGSTKVDAVLICRDTGVAVLFEAKVLSDVSTHVTFDMARNQLARNIDVMLEGRNPPGPLQSRQPTLSSLVLLTPGSFRDQPGMRRSRLYGWLFDAYSDAGGTLLHQHLEHREEQELAAVPDRLGWATWEDCNEVVTDACPWLRPDGLPAAAPSRPESLPANLQVELTALAASDPHRHKAVLRLADTVINRGLQAEAAYRRALDETAADDAAREARMAQRLDDVVSEDSFSFHAPRESRGSS